MTVSARTPRMTRPALQGAFTALVTPFTEDGELDEAAFRRLVRWQILAGIDGLVPCGTTGESPTLTTEERERLIAATVEVAAERPSRGRVTVIAGTGTNDTAATIRATRRAAALGAHAALVVAPYYNRPDGRMLEAHYRAVADEGDLPIVVYNVPTRTGTNVDADTFLRLAEHPRVIGIKEASGNLEQIARICRDRPRSVAVLAGDDAWTLPVLALGGNGVVSVASNEIPGELVALCAAARAGDWDGARRIHDRWLSLFFANFRGGPNPVPAKAALSIMGLIESDMVRGPLLPMEAGAREQLVTTLRGLGLVEVPAGRIATDARISSTRRQRTSPDRRTAGEVVA
jgi:4-hydroxy-tetrahydrodipicolinate synthase